MTVFSGDGFKDLHGALAALSRGSQIVQQDENFISYRFSYGGDDYVVSIGARDIEPDAAGGFGFGKAIGSLHVTNVTTSELAVIGTVPNMTLGEFLDIGKAKTVLDRLYSGDDHFGGAEGADLFDGRRGDDDFFGAAGKDTLIGGAGADSLEGEAGSDQLKGGGGADTLVGGAGGDRLSGGGGADLFIFEQASDSGMGSKSRDVISDFDRGADLINVLLLGGDGPAFSFVGKGGFTAENQIRYESDGKGATVFVNLDADAKAEVSIRLDGVGKLSADDFIL